MKKLQFVIILAVVMGMAPQARAGYLDPNATVPTSTPLQPPPQGIRPNLEQNVNTVLEEEQAGTENRQNPGTAVNGSQGQGENSSSANSGAQLSKRGAVNWKVLGFTALAAILLSIFYAFYRKRSRDW